MRKLLFKPFFQFLEDNEFDKVLEVGAGEHYHAGQYGIKCNKLILSDMEMSGNLDVVADATNLPFNNREFDLVICIAMLEHTWNFFKAIKEIKRATKKYLFVGVPFISSYHSPPDYWRFSEKALKRLVGWKTVFSFRTVSITKNIYTAHCTLFERLPEGKE